MYVSVGCICLPGSSHSSAEVTIGVITIRIRLNSREHLIEGPLNRFQKWKRNLCRFTTFRMRVVS